MLQCLFFLITASYAVSDAQRSNHFRLFQQTDQQQTPAQNTSSQVEIQIQDLNAITKLIIGADFQEYRQLINSNNRSEDFAQSDTKELRAVGYFDFTVDEYFDQQDLFILMKAVNDHSTYPTLVLSENNTYPSIQNDTICGTYGLGICSISPEMIKVNQTYHLAVYCKETCWFGIKVSYQREQILSLGDSIILQFNQDGSHLAKINVPKLLTQVDRIILRAHLVYGSQLDEAFYFYVNNGNQNPSPVQCDYKAEEIWITGKGVVIHNNSENLIKPGQNYTLVMTAPANTTIYLTSEYFEPLRSIYMFQVINDIVGPGEVNSYKLLISPYYKRILSKKDLSFDMNPIEGNPDIFVTTPPLPNTLDDYQWQSQLDLGYEGLTISPTSLNITENSEIALYISVRGSSEVSSYQFIFYISDKYNRLITKYSTESGFLSAKEYSHYNMILDEEESQFIKIQSQYFEGSGIILLKKCILNPDQEDNNQYEQIWDVLTATSNNFYDCHFTEAEIAPYLNSPITSESSNEIALSENATMIVSRDSISFSYNREYCTDNASPINLPYAENLRTRCRYVVAVASTSEDRTHYILVMKGKDTHTELLPYTPIRSYLLQKDIDYYHYRIRQSNITKVVFQFTVLNGDINAYASRLSTFPDSQNFEASSEFNLDQLVFHANDTYLNGDFYIAVEASSVATYTIILITTQEDLSLKRQANNSNVTLEFHPTYIALNDGIPQEVFATDKQAMYFAFKVHQITYSPIYINLDALTGTCSAYIVALSENVHTSQRTHPSEQNHTWSVSSHTRSLAIGPSDSNYISQGEYRIMVVPKEFRVQYEIQYSSQLSIEQIRVGQPKYDSLSQNAMHYYALSFTPQVAKVIITRTLTSSDLSSLDDVALYVSFTSMHPSERQCLLSLKGQKNSLLEINQSTIQNASCVNTCVLYIATKSFGGQNDYTLLVQFKNNSIELLEGISQISQVPITNEKAYFYFRARNSSIRIQSYSHQNLILYAKMVKYRDVQHLIRKNLYDDFHRLYPSEKDHQFKTEKGAAYGKAFIILSKQNVTSQPCSSDAYGCLILLSVVQNQLYYTMNDTGVFEIEASSDLVELRVGEPIQGYTQAGIIEFYKFKIHRPSKLIEFTLNPVDSGDPDLYVKYQTTDEDYVFPTQLNYDFRSTSFKGDILILQENNQFFRNRTTNGTYIIGVLGYTKSHFILEVNLMQIQYYTLLPGIIMDHIHLEPRIHQRDNSYDDMAFFKFNHYHNNSLRIIIAKSSGYLTFGVKTHPLGSYTSQQGTELDSLPFYNDTIPNIQQKFLDRMFGGVLSVSPLIQGYCSFCTYLIGVKNEGVQAEDISIVAASPDQPIRIQDGISFYDIALLNESGNYYQYYVTTKSAVINIKIHSGSANIRVGPYYFNLTENYLEQSLNVTDVFRYQKQNLMNGDLLYFIVSPFQGSTESVKYEICAIDSEDETRNIQLEKIEMGQIGPKQSISYYFISTGSDSIVTIYTNFGANQTLKGPILNIYFIKKNSKQNNTIDYLVQQKGSQSLQQQYILNQTDGVYNIVLLNQNSLIIDYVIILNTEEISVLQNNQAYFRRDFVDTRKYNFEVFLRKTEQLYLVIVECLGEVETEFVDKKKVNQTHQVEESQDVVFYVEPVDGPQHFQEKASVYLLIPYVLPKESKIPHYFIKYDESIQIKLKEDQLIFKFQGLTYDDQDIQTTINPELIVYSAHITNEGRYLKALSDCNLPIEYVKDFKFKDQDQKELYYKKYFKITKKLDSQDQILNISLPTDDLDYSEEYVFTVLAQVYYNTFQEPYTFSYDSKEFSINELRKSKKSRHSSKHSKSSESSEFETSSAAESANSKKSSKSQRFSSSSENEKQTSESFVFPNKIFDLDSEIVIFGLLSVLGVVLVFILYKFCYLKYRKSHFKEVATKVKQDEIEE